MFVITNCSILRVHGRRRLKCIKNDYYDVTFRPDIPFFATMSRIILYPAKYTHVNNDNIALHKLILTDL